MPRRRRATGAGRGRRGRDRQTSSRCSPVGGSHRRRRTAPAAAARGRHRPSTCPTPTRPSRPTVRLPWGSSDRPRATYPGAPGTCFRTEREPMSPSRSKRGMLMFVGPPVLATTDPPLSDAGNTQLLLAAVLAIAAVVVLIVWAKFHPFLALMIGTGVLGLVAWVPPLDVLHAFVDGLGTTFGSVGLLIALGAMLGKLLADSGGANEIVDRIIGRVGANRMPWAMALIAAIVGLPMFFEIGVVILVPIIILVGLRPRLPLMKIGIPALAGLSVLHGLVPPHPGPVTAIGLLHADLGRTLILGLIVAVPTLIIAGPILATFLDRLVPVQASEEHAAALMGGALPPTTTVTKDEPVTERDSPRGGSFGGARRPVSEAGGVGETAAEADLAADVAAPAGN